MLDGWFKWQSQSVLLLMEHSTRWNIMLKNTSWMIMPLPRQFFAAIDVRLSNLFSASRKSDWQATKAFSSWYSHILPSIKAPSLFQTWLTVCLIAPADLKHEDISWIIFCHASVNWKRWSTYPPPPPPPKTTINARRQKFAILFPVLSNYLKSILRKSSWLFLYRSNPVHDELFTGITRR